MSTDGQYKSMTSVDTRPKPLSTPSTNTAAVIPSVQLLSSLNADHFQKAHNPSQMPEN